METPQSDPNSPPPPAAPPPEPPAPAPEPPRAAAVVIEGKTPRELELESKLADAQKAARDKDLSLMQLDEENRLLKRVTPAPKRKKGCLEAFLAGEA